MNNDEFHQITEAMLALLPYNSEIIFPDEKAYRKEFSSEDLEWRELGDGWNRQIFKASARLAAEYALALIWTEEHKNPNHKYVTGDRLDSLQGEADKLSGRARMMFEQANTQDQLLEAKLREERAQGMYEMIRLVRGYHEGN